MKKGKSQFSFPYSDRSESIIRDFLNANGYKYVEPKNAENYYAYKDGMCNGGLQYQITGNNVTVYFFLGKSKKPLLVDDSFAGSVPKQHYKSVLKPLFDALSNPDGAGAGMQTANNDTNASPAAQSTYSGNQFEAGVSKSREKFAIIAFVVSLLGLVLSLIGFTYGVAILILEFYFACMGLKTKLKGLSIAALVIAGVSLLIIIAQVVLVFYGTMLL